MLLYNYPYTLKIEPRNHHSFRQYDCLSFAQSFYNDRGSLSEPCLNNLGGSGNGKTASEFPIIQFFVGNLWKLTGINTVYYRLINLAFLFYALFFMYKLFLEEFKNKIFAALIAALIFSSPILSYYGVSVLSDIQALSLSLIGFYYFYNWVKTRKNLQFILFICLFTLAGLLKVSSALMYLLCIIYYFLDHSKNKPRQFSISGNTIKQFSLFLLPILVWTLWYLHAKAYNEKNNSDFFLIGILPIWQLNESQITEVLRCLLYDTLPAFFNPSLLFIVFICILSSIYLIFKKTIITRLLLIICFLFFISYILLFFQALDRHDYYLINMISLLVLAIFFISKLNSKILLAKTDLIIFVLSVLVALNTYTSSIKTWKKINFNVQNIENSLAFNHHEQKNFFWIYWLSRSEFKGIEDKNLRLENLGIGLKDTIMCLGDNTINASLYLLNRVGYTDYNRPFQDPTYFINHHKNIHYLVLLKPSFKTDTNLMHLCDKKIFEKDSLSIFSLRFQKK